MQQPVSKPLDIRSWNSKDILAILAQQRYKLADPPMPERLISRRSIDRRGSRLDYSFRHPYLPNPDTPDNHIIYDAYGFGPRPSFTHNSTTIPQNSATVTQDSATITRNSHKESSGHQLIPGLSNLLKRVARPSKLLCTPENE